MFGRGAIAAVTVRVTGTVLARARHLGHRMPPGIPGQGRGERRPVYVPACQPAAQDARSHLAVGQHRGAAQPALAHSSESCGADPGRAARPTARIRSALIRAGGTPSAASSARVSWMSWPSSTSMRPTLTAMPRRSASKRFARYGRGSRRGRLLRRACPGGGCSSWWPGTRPDG